MEWFANWPTYGAGRPVLDKTGLTGSYDFTLDWSPDFGGPHPPDPSGADLFTALQEQLGLKLEPQRVPIEMLIIDHAGRPSEN
ncbi:MAG TPA: TIGR03435 family protein [Bryobacteraceae bacterium]|nr:TIGR03435 family protein [Bryobacteraceae bacterium]